MSWSTFFSGLLLNPSSSTLHFQTSIFRIHIKDFQFYRKKLVTRLKPNNYRILELFCERFCRSTFWGPTVLVCPPQSSLFPSCPPVKVTTLFKQTLYSINWNPSIKFEIKYVNKLSDRLTSRLSGKHERKYITRKVWYNITVDDFHEKGKVYI